MKQTRLWMIGLLAYLLIGCTTPVSSPTTTQDPTPLPNPEIKVEPLLRFKHEKPTIAFGTVSDGLDYILDTNWEEISVQGINTQTLGVQVWIFSGHHLGQPVTQSYSVTIVDDVAPVFSNVRNLEFEQGTPFAHDFVAKDNADPAVTVQIKGETTTSTVGSYELIAAVTDASGNTNEVPFTVTIKAKAVAVVPKPEPTKPKVETPTTPKAEAPVKPKVETPVKPKVETPVKPVEPKEPYPEGVPAHAVKSTKTGMTFYTWFSEDKQFQFVFNEQIGLVQSPLKPKEEPIPENKILCPHAWTDVTKPCDWIKPNSMPKDMLGRTVPTFPTQQEAWDWAMARVEEALVPGEGVKGWYNSAGFSIHKEYTNEGKIFYFPYMHP